MKLKKIDLDDFAFIVSGLTEAIGESVATSSEKGRMLSWGDGGSDGGYLMTLIIDDNGKFHALIGDHVDSLRTYAAIGFCRYHGINVELAWETTD